MNYITFGNEDGPTYSNVILVNKMRKDLLLKEHVQAMGLDPRDTVVIQLHQNPAKKKTPAAERVEFIKSELVDLMQDIKAQYIFIADGEYFKTISKTVKADAWLGYRMTSEFFPNTKCFYLPSVESVFHDPDKVRAKIQLVADSMKLDMAGFYQPPGSSIIGFAEYPNTVADIRTWLKKLKEMNVPLACDIEAFSLKFNTAGIGTITFAWSQTEGIAFPVDLMEDEVNRKLVRNLLIDFFETYEAPIMYHNIGYDVTVLIYQLFMKDILDFKGLQYGLKVMLKNWHDTRLIAYLATNSCAGNDLGLKDLSQPYSGNYAVEVKDIRKVPLPQLLNYNLIDGLSTWYVFNEYYPRMVAEDQYDLYETVFKSAMKDIIHMQLTGLPVNMPKVIEVTAILQADSDKALKTLLAAEKVQEFTYLLNEEWVVKRNSELKVKRVSLADAKEVFNPNSGPQLIRLLYEACELPVLARTDSKLPSTEGDVLKALLKHTDDPAILELLSALIDYKAVDKILTSTMPALADAVAGPDGWHYLCGNFNLGGTVSGRLSSSGPNLQNLPATGTKYAKLVKSCFSAPPGWVFCGIDFDSLEDRISALTTRDPEKLKVYTDGFDGHCLRAFSYFMEQMPDIAAKLDLIKSGGKVYACDTGSGVSYYHESEIIMGSNLPLVEVSAIEAEVAIINSIAGIHKDLRQESKAPTFALTYQGTFKTLMTNCGFTEAKAKMIEARFKILYAESIKWVNAKLDQASKDGFITGAFGLKLRTPLLKQVVRGTNKTPYEAEAEGRTAGNALGQSWCLLNSRAGTEFLAKVRGETVVLGHNGQPVDFSEDIRPCAQIHDAQYYLIRDNVDALLFANEHVVTACQWQDHPDIWHDEVKLGGQFFLCWPSWDHEISIPNGADEDQLRNTLTKYIAKMAEKGVDLLAA